MTQEEANLYNSDPAIQAWNNEPDEFKEDSSLSDYYAGFNAAIRIATPPPQGLAKEQKEKIKQINELCGTVNFSSHNQMKEAIQGTVELSDEILASLAMGAAPQTDAMAFAEWLALNKWKRERARNGNGLWYVQAAGYGGGEPQMYTTEQLYSIFKQNK